MSNTTGGSSSPEKSSKIDDALADTAAKAGVNSSSSSPSWLPNGTSLVPGPSSGSSKKDKDTAATKQEQQPLEQVMKIEEIKKALEQMKLMQSVGRAASPASQPKTAEEAKKKKYEFWETQPVPKIGEEIGPSVDGENVNEAIDPNTDVEKVRKEPLPLPDGFIWVSMDIDNEEELKELYTLLYENYVEDDDNMFRFNYSREFLLWVLKPPHFNVNWFCGVRVAPKPGATKLGKLVGFVSAIPAKVRVYDKEIPSVEINFLCVHKKLRSKRMAPVLIKEITRRVNLTGVWQALYTAGVFIPKPISTCRYYHRSLNPKKLIDVGFSSLSRNMNMSRTLKFYRLPEEPKLAGLRRMEPKKDLKQMAQLMRGHMDKFDLVTSFDEAELAHWLSPIPDVVDTWVVEKLNPTTKKKDIVAFFSFYILPSTVMNHPNHKDVKAAYSFYNVTSGDITLVDLMSDALIVAKNSGLDVFNALNQMENDQFLTKLKFGSGDGSLHYYLFNWKCAPIKPEKVGVVLQ